MNRRFDPELALREAEGMVKALVSRLCMPARVLDPDRRVLFENRPWLAVKAAPGCAGACAHGDVAPPGRGCPYCEIERHMRAGVAKELRTRLAGLDCRLGFEPVPGEDGTVAGVEAMFLPWTG
ncbi:MAG: hypothetical protein N3A38_09910 [Planctomycetota bacterium]|nr:hypothetical protein [Planctomycetota bacterium]